MKIFIIIIYLCFIVSARKHKKTKYTSTSSESDASTSSSSDESDVFSFSDDYFDFRGKIKRSFALEAALQDHGRNMICSPVTALIPLAKLLVGAKRRAEKELLIAIGLKKTEQLKSAIAHLITNMMYLQGVTLDVASRIYISSDKSINENFKDVTKKIFHSSVQKIDVYDPRETAAKINDWVADKTRNKITKLVSSSDITKDVSMILVNAIYFAGRWAHPFEKSFTGDFYSPSGVRRLPMMSHDGRYKYWKSDIINAEVVEIPYEGKQASMVVVLPFSRTGLPALLRTLKLSSKVLNKELEKMKLREIILTMPKFKIETELDMKRLYQKLGLRSIFDSRSSGLTGIVEDEEVYVTKAIHKAIIEVNEKGTEAAAVSGVAVEYLSSVFNQRKFLADRPFLFYIKQAKEQLFSGVFSG
ncbi:hypothetical protein PYW08_014972 [Mythimna loreyi]|uniref:Uncharacterized protein n=1 Tax=Mythimna loreyi TaxID=667449 RepID=A0ACC2R5W9_9NEOP|nr:hypothetical protein PYW08_014972 [Mythimna loreyi]